MLEDTHCLKSPNKVNLLLEFQLQEVKVQKMFSTPLVEKKRKDQKSRPCITKLMERLDQESRNTEITFGLFLKISIDLDMQKRKFLKAQDSLSILKESTELFQRRSLSRKPLKISSLSHRTFSDSRRISDKENPQFLTNTLLEQLEEIQMSGTLQCV